jgi:uncharacterized protein YPO0396
VETAAELADGPSDDLRVTLAGQTRRGRRGTHGRSDTTNIIGFSNREAIADIDAKIAVLRQELAGIDISLREVDERQDLARRQRDACAAALRYSWDDIDTATVQKQVTDLQARQQAMLSADDQLAALEAQIRDLGRDLDTAQRHRHALDQTIEGLDLAHMRMVDEQDGVADEMVDLESGGDVVLDEQSEALLSERFAAAAHPQDPDNLDDFDANLRRLRERLRSSVDAAQTQADRAAADLEHIFAQYLTIWPDPNLGTGVGFYREYAEILENIRSTGLHERRAEWRRRLTEWSGQDLVPLSYALDSAVEDIIDRLEPINGILAGLPFGAGQDRLRIRLRRLTQHNVTVFRQELKTLSSAATGGIPEEAMEARFQTLQRFMAQLRRREDTRLTAELMAIQDRDRLLDVRKHVEITAERYGESGEVLSTHSSLGDKSGGESQELVAFIVGAALRFRLGDELRARPRFAPVLLDEGFVKADGEFAGRAVGAWKGLGFQLVVSAPLDKVTALEPHMDAVLLISKNTTTNYSYLSVVRDPHAPAFASPSPCAAASDEDGAVLAGGGCVP